MFNLYKNLVRDFKVVTRNYFSYKIKKYSIDIKRFWSLSRFQNHYILSRIFKSSH